jgi:predicted MFS family arabinose efflux permease
MTSRVAGDRHGRPGSTAPDRPGSTAADRPGGTAADRPGSTDPDRPGSTAKDAGPGAVREVGRDLRAGLGILARSPAARALLPVTVIFLAANASLTAVLIPFGIQHLGGSRPTGFLLAALGVGFLLGAPALRALLDRWPARTLLAAALSASAASYWLLWHSGSLAAALPAAVAVGMSGSMALVIPQVTVQRVIPNAALGRISAVFLTGEAAATLAGAVTGPLLAESLGMTGLAATVSLATLAAAVLAFTLVPPAQPALPAPQTP